MPIPRLSFRRRPKLSVVVVSFNMERELPRTLFTLQPPYQLGLRPDELEVVVVDNGSRTPPDPSRLPANTRLVRIADASPSPAQAVNRGLAEARADLIGVMIDGARMASPGLLGSALRAARLCERAVVGTLGFHLGPDWQMRSVAAGYCQEREDRLLASVDWRADGYCLFDISVFAGSSECGWFAPMAESNALFLRRRLWRELGGYDERFESAGGGLVNLDTYGRACDLPDTTLVTLLGEGTFHQVHGGAATSRPLDDSTRALWSQEYRRIRGRPFCKPQRQPLLCGSIPQRSASSFIRSSLYLAGSDPASAAAQVLPGAQRGPGQPLASAPAWASADPSLAPIAVLGMHRSGTSCLTGLLEDAGVWLGEVQRHNPHNLKGNQESLAVMRLHDRVLLDNGTAWDAPPGDDCIWRPERLAELRALLGSFPSDRVWAMKDPRTCFTLAAWKNEVPLLRFIGTVRHPLAVAASLRRRDPRWELGQGVALWCRYNRRLLELKTQHGFPIVCFDLPAEDYLLQVAAVFSRLGLKLAPTDAAFFDRGLRQQAGAPGAALPAQAADLYEMLCALAG